MVTGEDAEATRVLGQRGGDAELGREVGDCIGLRLIVVVVLVPAGLHEVLLQALIGCAYALHQAGVGGEFLKTLSAQASELGHGILTHLVPSLGIEGTEQLTGVRVPGPTKIHRKGVQGRKRRGQNRANGKSTKCSHMTGV